MSNPPQNWEEICRRSLIWLLVFSLPIILALDAVSDPDIWWHMRVGQWIWQNGQVPATDLYSAYGSGKTWVAYSWLFELLVYGLYQVFDLAGIAGLNVAMALAISVALYGAIRNASLPLLAEAGLVSAAAIAMVSIYSPRPWLFTILFYVIELRLIFQTRASGRSAQLYFLPPLFLIWANLHVQFVYGVAIYCLFCFECVCNRILGNRDSGSPKLARLLSVGIASVAATWVNPYGVMVYRPIFDYVGDTSAFEVVTELMPLIFQSTPEFLAAGLVGLAGIVLVWQRRFTPFPILLLLLSSALALRARRDVWFAVVSAVAIVAYCRGENFTHRSFRWNWGSYAVVSAGLAALTLFLASQRDLTLARLRATVKNAYPVDAVSFVSQARLPGPLYNPFNWGGYLIWALPELPVAMDGRTNLHGEARIRRSVSTWEGKTGWQNDPELIRARLVIAPTAYHLTKLLQSDRRFRLVYQDRTALVFVAVGLQG